MIGYTSFGESRRRRRRQASWRVVRFLLGAGAVVMVGGYGYQVGVSAHQARTDQLETDLGQAQESNLDLQERLARAAQHSDRAEAALEELRRRYAAEVPRGELAGLFGQMRAQLEAGVASERLAFLIAVAGQQDTCESPPVTKRFMPRTPLAEGPISFIRFDDRITVTGTGHPARNPEGLTEAWYDPVEPVVLTFQTLDGAVQRAEGVVPFNHAMMVDGREYRFAVVAGEQRFVEVTAQACDLPDPADDEPSAAGLQLDLPGLPD
jgi:cell division protein FtsB